MAENLQGRPWDMMTKKLKERKNIYFFKLNSKTQRDKKYSTLLQRGQQLNMFPLWNPTQQNSSNQATHSKSFAEEKCVEQRVLKSCKNQGKRHR